MRVAPRWRGVEYSSEESYSVSDEGGSAVEGGGDGFAESDSGAEGGHADGESDHGAERGYANGGESDSRAEGGRGDVWGDVDEALSAVGSEDYNEADSCKPRSQDSRSSYSSSSSNASLRS
jgi:hypothetical protein